MCWAFAAVYAEFIYSYLRYVMNRYKRIPDRQDMDPIKNPYSPGAGSPPPELVGRDRNSADFRTEYPVIGRP